MNHWHGLDHWHFYVLFCAFFSRLAWVARNLQIIVPPISRWTCLPGLLISISFWTAWFHLILIIHGDVHADLHHQTLTAWLKFEYITPVNRKPRQYLLFSLMKQWFLQHRFNASHKETSTAWKKKLKRMVNIIEQPPYLCSKHSMQPCFKFPFHFMQLLVLCVQTLKRVIQTVRF